MNESDSHKMVVKSNHLIEASYRLTTQEQRIILLMASMIKPEDEDFQLYRIDIKYFMKLVGLKDKNSYAEIREITKRLGERTLYLQKGESELQIWWLSSAEYFFGKGYVELEFSPKLKPYLLKLKEFFTKYPLANIIRLKGSYSIRIYELLKQYEVIGERTFTLEDLRTTLGILPSEYRLYGHFKSRVLRPAQKELTQKTDLTFDFKEEKKGRRIFSVRFIIKKNEPKSACKEAADLEEFAPFQTSNPELFQRLQASFCLSAIQTKKVLKNYDEAYIEGNLKVVEQAYKSGTVKSLAPYTLKALKEDFRPKKTGLDQEKEDREKRLKEQEQEKALIAKLQTEFDSEVKKEADRLLSQLTSDEKEQRIKLFEQEVILKNKGLRLLYKERGINSSLFLVQFESFLVKKEGLDKYQNLVVYAKNQGIHLERDEKGDYRLALPSC